MSAILGIDAAWTEHEPSGVALVAGSEVEVVAVDMPMSIDSISGRRPADDEVSRAFGDRHCSAHSPSSQRPGALGARLTAALTRLGFRLATTSVPAPAGRTLLEVSPHTALLSLLQVERRVAYKVSKSARLWPDLSIQDRIAELLTIFRTIHAALEGELGPLPFDIPAAAASLRDLKRYEDALDAVVSAWMGTLHLRSRATPLGDDRAAVWVPSDTIRMAVPACPLCTALRSRLLIAANACAVAFFDGFPVSPGHALIVARRHCGNLFELSEPEQLAIWQLLPVVKAAIEQLHRPTAYNLGVNIGADAGQTVDHVHVHVVPRYRGDVKDPRGGVRWVLPATADYWSRPR